jgi:hypothetical protein
MRAVFTRGRMGDHTQMAKLTTTGNSQVLTLHLLNTKLLKGYVYY